MSWGHNVIVQATEILLLYIVRRTLAIRDNEGEGVGGKIRCS